MAPIKNEFVILAGGLGTRLEGVSGDLPKSMVDVRGRPFLSYILDALSEQDVRAVVLAVGHRNEKIRSYFKDSYKNLKLSYSIEDRPLGTGGAIRSAMAWVRSDNFIVLNGDTFCEIDYRGLLAQHERKHARLTLSLKRMESADRYGTVSVDDQSCVRSFQEKQAGARGLINTGVYAISQAWFKGLDLPESFSLENEVLAKEFATSRIFGFETEGYFLDIGIPADYERAQHEFQRFGD